MCDESEKLEECERFVEPPNVGKKTEGKTRIYGLSFGIGPTTCKFNQFNPFSIGLNRSFKN
jgi:hypothetical protein